MSPTSKVQVRDAGTYGDQVPFEHIKEPGTYVSNWSGHLIRIPEDAVNPGRSPVLEILGKEDLHVTKVSENPFITVTKDRMIASDLDLEVNF